MIAMATALLGAYEATVTVSAVRLEAENGRPIVRAVVSGQTPARVERSGRDLVLVLPGAHPRAGLLLPFPNAGIAELTLKDGREGARIRIRLDKPLDYELRQEPGLMTVTIVPWAPVRDVNAKVLWSAPERQPEEAASVPKPVPWPPVPTDPAPAVERPVRAEAAPPVELPVPKEAPPALERPAQTEVPPAAEPPVQTEAAPAVEPPVQAETPPPVELPVHAEVAPAVEPSAKTEAAPAIESPVQTEGRPAAASPVPTAAAPAEPTVQTAPSAAPPVIPVPRAEFPSASAARDVRDLYAKILPPPAGAGPEEGARVEGGVDEPVVPREGFYFGPVRVRPTLVTSYIDADTALLDTPQPVRDSYFQIEPRLVCDTGPPVAGSRRFELIYTPRFRTRASFAELRSATHVLNASIDIPVGPTVVVHAGHHYANGVLETTEVDPGREYFFRLAPFTRHETTGGISLRSGGRLALGVTGTRDAVRLAEDAGFFDHRRDSAAGILDYELGSVSRAYLRYQWDRVPPSVERPIIESRASSVVAGVAGEIIPLVTGEFSAGYTRLSAPHGGSGGKSFSGLVLDAHVRKQFTPAASLTLFARRSTYPSGFEENAFYVATGGGVEADLGLPLSLVFHGSVGRQRNAYRVAAAELGVPRRDDIVSWSAGVGRSLTRWSYLRVDYRADRRDSNLPAFATDGHTLILQVGLGYLGASPAGEAAR
jgi:hypothetical protein